MQNRVRVARAEDKRADRAKFAVAVLATHRGKPWVAITYVRRYSISLPNVNMDQKLS